MASIGEIFLKEALQLIDDEEMRLGVLAKYKLKSYAEDYSNKIQNDPDNAKRILKKINAAISKILKEK